MFNRFLLNNFAQKMLNGIIWRFFFYFTGFFLNLAIANFMGANDSGRFYLLLTNLSFAILIFSFGLETAISYFQSKREVRTGLLLMISILWSALATAFVIFLYKALSVPGLISKNEFAGYSLFYIGSNILSNCLASIYIANTNNKTPGLVFSLINIVLLLLVPGFIFPYDLFTFSEFSRIYLTLNCIPAIILSVMLLLNNDTSSTNTRKLYISFKKVIPFAFLSFAANILIALVMKCDYWIVDYFCNDHQLGNYLQTSKITQIVLFLPTIAAPTLMPLLVKQNNSGDFVGKKVLQLSLIYFLISLGMSVFILLTGYWLLPWLYGESFSNMYILFVLLTPGLLCFASSYPISSFFISKNKIKVNIVGLLITLVLLVMADLYLIPAYNVYGAAIGSSLAFIFYFLYLLIYFKKFYRMRLKEVLFQPLTEKQKIIA